MEYIKLFTILISIHLALVNSQWIQRGPDIDGEAAGDQSGSSVAMSYDGSVIAIGAITNNGINGDNSGHVRVLEFNGTNYIQRGQDIDGEATGDESGKSVAMNIDGSVIAIGADENDGKGHVRVYEFNGTEYVQRGQDIDGETADEFFGSSLAMSYDGSVIAIGDSQYDGRKGGGPGLVRVFEFNGTEYIQRGQDIDGIEEKDLFGFSVAMNVDGSVIAIGAPFVGPSSGSVRVYNFNGTDYVQRVQEFNVDGTMTDYTQAFIGASVAMNIDGTVIAIGASGFPATGEFFLKGVVRVYEFNGIEYVQRGQDIKGEDEGDFSGRFVAMNYDGSVIAIGAPGNDGTPRVLDERGHVRVYDFNGNEYVQRGQDIDGEAGDDFSGISVAMNYDGSVIAIGAAENDNSKGANSGHVRVFEFNKNETSRCAFDINGEITGDLFGHSVAMNIDGSIVAIGGPSNKGDLRFSGHVRVLEFNGTNYVQRGQDINGDGDPSSSGFSVAMSADGSVLAIGAVLHENVGLTRVYKFNGTEYVQRGQDLDGEAGDDFFGYSVAMSYDGSVIAIGAPFNDGNGNNAGNVRVYEFNGTSYVPRGQDIDGEAAGDEFGFSVAMSYDGSILAIGAKEANGNNGNDLGHVRVYEFNGTTYIQRGPNIDGETEGDEYGFSVAMNFDGSIIAIGARQKDDSVIAFRARQNAGNGHDSGYVRVYEFNGTNYVQRGQDIDGEEPEDLSGTSVAMNFDGSVIAIGADGNDGNGMNAGHVRVYKFNGTEYIQLGQDIDGDDDGNEFGHSVAMSFDGSVIAIGAPQNGAGYVRVLRCSPIQNPTLAPTHNPTIAPTHIPTIAPTHNPTTAPTHNPTIAPTHNPTIAPTHNPTIAPIHNPTTAPTQYPTLVPTHSPTALPVCCGNASPNDQRRRLRSYSVGAKPSQPGWSLEIFPGTKHAARFILKPGNVTEAVLSNDRLQFAGVMVPTDWAPEDGDQLNLYFNLSFSDIIPLSDCTCTTAAKNGGIRDNVFCNWNPFDFARKQGISTPFNCGFCASFVSGGESICQLAVDTFSLQELPQIVADWVSYNRAEGSFYGPGLDLIRRKVRYLYPHLRSSTCTIDISGLPLSQSGCTDYNDLPDATGEGGSALGYGVNGVNFNCGFSSWFKCKEDNGFLRKLGDINFEFMQCPLL